MDKKQNLIPLQELNLTSRFLFDEVLEDPQIHQDVLGIIFQSCLLYTSPSPRDA